MKSILHIQILALFSFIFCLSCQTTNVDVVTLSNVNFDGLYKECNKTGRTHLELLSKSSNNIVDDDVWLTKYAKGMANCVTYTFTPGGNNASKNIEAIVPIECNGLYRRSIDIFDQYSVIYYGKKYDYFGVDPTLILITSPSVQEIRYALDFSKFSVSQFSSPEDVEYTNISVSGVQIEDDTLYACISHPTYSASSSGYNAYLVAVDLCTQTIKWITKPLTCNSNFVIYNDVIFTGYGFSNEADYVYVIDKASGDRISSILLDKGPSYFSVIDNKLYVRTYNLDYTFQIVK